MAKEIIVKNKLSDKDFFNLIAQINENALEVESFELSCALEFEHYLILPHILEKCKNLQIFEESQKLANALQSRQNKRYSLC